MTDKHNMKINKIETKTFRKTEVSTPNDITFGSFHSTCTKWVLNNDLTLHLALTLGGVAI